MGIYIYVMEINNLFLKYSSQMTDQLYELVISDLKLSTYSPTATECLFLDKSLLGTTSTAILYRPFARCLIWLYNIIMRFESGT